MHLFFIVLLFLLNSPFSYASASGLSTDEIIKQSFRDELDNILYPVISELIHERNELLPLAEIPNELEAYFFSRSYFAEYFYDEIIQLVNDKITLLIVEFETSAMILSILRSICDRSKRQLIEMRKPIVKTNQIAIKVLADICHLFKAPLTRLILTSKALGHDEMFKDALVLLEIIRNKFLSETDIVLFFDFNEKLGLIRISLDYYFSKNKPRLLNSLAIYESLKSETMAQVDIIIDEIKAEQHPLKKYSSGLGKIPINTNLKISDLERSTTNEDLWAFLMEKVRETRGIIKTSFPQILTFHETSVIDVINEELMRQRYDLEPFNIHRIRSSMKISADMYFVSLKKSLCSQLEPESYQLIKEQIECVGHILAESLERFNEEISAKIIEIFSKLGLTSEEIRGLDFAVVAVSELAKERAHILEQELQEYL